MTYDIVVGRSAGDKAKFGTQGTIFLGKHYVTMGQTVALSNKVYLDLVRSHVRRMDRDHVHGTPQSAWEPLEQVTGHEPCSHPHMLRVPARQVDRQQVQPMVAVGTARSTHTGAFRFRNRRMACSARNSEDSRGTNTPGSTRSSIPRNSVDPLM